MAGPISNGSLNEILKSIATLWGILLLKACVTDRHPLPDTGP
jgi:hypothetical protein